MCNWTPFFHKLLESPLYRDHSSLPVRVIQECVGARDHNSLGETLECVWKGYEQHDEAWFKGQHNALGQ